MSLPTVFAYKYRIETNVKDIKNKCFVLVKCHDIESWIKYHILLTRVDIIETERIGKQLSSIFNANLVDKGVVRSSDNNSSIIWCVLKAIESIEIYKFKNVLHNKEIEDKT